MNSSSNPLDSNFGAFVIFTHLSSDNISFKTQNYSITRRILGFSLIWNKFSLSSRALKVLKIGMHLRNAEVKQVKN